MLVVIFILLLLYLHLSIFFILLLFFSLLFDVIPHPSVDYRTITRVFTPHFILSAQPIAEWFATLSFVEPFCSCRGRYGLEWAFFTHRRFITYAPSQHFWHNLFLSRPPWEPAVLPWSLQGFILVFKTQTRPSCLFDSQ